MAALLPSLPLLITENSVKSIFFIPPLLSAIATTAEAFASSLVEFDVTLIFFIVDFAFSSLLIFISPVPNTPETCCFPSIVMFEIFVFSKSNTPIATTPDVCSALRLFITVILLIASCFILNSFLVIHAIPPIDALSPSPAVILILLYFELLEYTLF